MVEVIIDVAIIAIIALAVFSAFSSAFKSVRASKAKITAVSIANERIEIIRNMPYDSVGTTGQTYPPGTIPSSESLSRNNVNYIVETTVSYVDDPFDGTINTNPIDTYPYDYKKVEVKVRRSGSNINLASFTTNIAANAAETATNTGILFFCAVNAADEPIDGATLTISNDDLDPPLLLTFVTGVDGCVMVPMLPPDSHNGYHLEITKDGYSLAMTYPRTAQNPNQNYPDIDIIAQQVTRVSMHIDLVSSLKIRAFDLNGAPIPNLSIHLEDDFEIYFNPSTFRYVADHQLDGNGEIIISDLAYANYNLTVNTPGYYISSINPGMPFYLPPDTNDAVIDIYLTTSSTAPTIESVDPPTGMIVDALTITIYGDNFDSGSVLKLINSTTLAEIVATDVDMHSNNEISGTFDLTGGSVGDWDMFVSNPNAEFSRKVDAFEIVN
ncbi:MAG: hypothetical protein BWY19_01131 [bacterium ADurb.Bin212]|jgi:type II secretory pathway pseudopilin PulG|nr:MAG: hypothetical protein BWY19_01131 [bacterium ADurb.Bin212]